MSGTKRRYKASRDTTINEIKRIMVKLKATNVRLLFDLMGTKKAAEIHFDRKVGEGHRRYVVTMEANDHPDDNLRALMYALEAYYRLYELFRPGTTWVPTKDEDRAFEQAFAGKDATPVQLAGLLQSGTWWETLGLTNAKPTRQELDAAYRAMARIYHPDQPTGDHERFLRIKAALDEGMAAIGLTGEEARR